MDEIQKPKGTAANGPGFETTDAQAGPLYKWSALLVVILLFSVLLMHLFFGFKPEQQEGSAPPVTAHFDPKAMEQIFPQPVLQPVERDDMKKFREEQDAILNHYSWVDSAQGIVRVPIQKAIEMMAEKGLPVRAEGGEK